MTNTITNVPRELLADLLGNDHDKRIMAERHLLAMLANAPSPAGVDGLVAVKVWEADADWDDHELVVRLSAAQAIIDGLRGENERIRLNIAEYNEAISCYQSERDQQAQRIGELEGLLRAESARVDFLDAYIVTADAPDTGKVAMLADSGTLRECIDAALSAGKEGE